MIGLMIRIRRDALRCGNRRPRVFRRLAGPMDIREHAPPRQYKTGRDGPNLSTTSWASNVANNHQTVSSATTLLATDFLSGWVQVRASNAWRYTICSGIWEDVQLDAKQRQLIWPD